MTHRIDLDHNATTPLLPEVQEAMRVALQDLPGNPSSLHAAGRRAQEAVEQARTSVAALIGGPANEIIFTSGGTEANVLALAGSLDGSGRRLVLSSIEHPSVLETASFLEGRGQEVRWIDPLASGHVDPVSVSTQAAAGPVLVSLMLANNETGALQPVSEVGRLVDRERAIIHTDAVQAAGKIPIDVVALGVDLLTLSAHKVGGPKGVGALWCRSGARPHPILHGGEQEGGLRAGTQNVPGIVGFGVAAEAAAARLEIYAVALAPLRDLLETTIQRCLSNVSVLGARAPRVANTSSIAFSGVEGTALVQLLDLKGVAVSTGAACEARSDEYSHVLRAMGVPEDLARGAVRFSLGAGATEEEIREALERIIEAVEELRGR
jgi:cysteine desulfurase